MSPELQSEMALHRYTAAPRRSETESQSSSRRVGSARQPQFIIITALPTTDRALENIHTITVKEDMLIASRL